MNEVCESSADNSKWYQKIITVRQANEWNTKSVSIDLWIIRASTMDYLKFGAEIYLDSGGLILAISLPYFRVWIGRHFHWKYWNLGTIKPVGRK